MGFYSNPRHRSKDDQDGLCRPCFDASGPVSSIIIGDCGPVSGGKFPTPTKHRRSLSYRFVGSKLSSVLSCVPGHCQQSGGWDFSWSPFPPGRYIGSRLGVSQKSPEGPWVFQCHNLLSEGSPGQGLSSVRDLFELGSLTALHPKAVAPRELQATFLCSLPHFAHLASSSALPSTTLDSVPWSLTSWTPSIQPLQALVHHPPAVQQPPT